MTSYNFWLIELDEIFEASGNALIDHSNLSLSLSLSLSLLSHSLCKPFFLFLPGFRNRDRSETAGRSEHGPGRLRSSRRTEEIHERQRIDQLPLLQRGTRWGAVHESL